MRRALLLCAWVSLCFIAAALPAEERPLAKKVDHIFVVSDQAQEPANPLVGHGLGVDHVGIIVRSLDKTLSDYEQALGFKCFRVPRIPDAIVSSCIFFENNTYLELISVTGQDSGASLSGQAKRYADFAEKHEGAMFLGLATSSAKDAADYLKAHNFEVFLFGEESVKKEGETKPSPPLAHFIIISHEPTKNIRAFTLPIFPLEYVSQHLDDIREDRMMIHPNTALRLHSVWFAVRDLDSQLGTIQQAGLEPGDTREAKFLGGKGREVKAGHGCLLLLQSTDENGLLNTFLSNRDDGEIIGVSIEVSDLNKARSWVEGHSGRKLEPSDGFYGRSILIPPDLTHGVWMELFRR
jgi:catechol 2,3-dioxygenase-like lactoylglutathione lyase family enzyme